MKYKEVKNNKYWLDIETGESFITQTSIEPVPENFYELAQLLGQRGMYLSNIKIYKHGKELIPCVNKTTGIEGFYDITDETFT